MWFEIGRKALHKELSVVNLLRSLRLVELIARTRTSDFKIRKFGAQVRRLTLHRDDIEEDEVSSSEEVEAESYATEQLPNQSIKKHLHVSLVAHIFPC